MLLNAKYSQVVKLVAETWNQVAIYSQIFCHNIFRWQQSVSKYRQFSFLIEIIAWKVSLPNTSQP